MSHERLVYSLQEPFMGFQDEADIDLAAGGEEDLSYLDVQGESLTLTQSQLPGTDTTSLNLEFESLQFGDTTLTNIELHRTNRHTFACSWTMIIFTLIPLLVLILDSVYLGHLVWITIAENMEPLEHSLWRLELTFIVLQNLVGMFTIVFMLVVTVTGTRIRFNVIFTSLLALVIISTGSSIWSYKESSHTHCWFPSLTNQTSLPQYIIESKWFTPTRFVQLKLVEITAIFIMLWIWIWNWEQVLELRGDRENSSASESASSSTADFQNPGCSTSSSRGLFSLKVPRILTDKEPEPPSSSSTRTDAVDRNLNGTKPSTEFGAGAGDDTKTEVEFREDGDSPGLAEPSRILQM